MIPRQASSKDCFSHTQRRTVSDRLKKYSQLSTVPVSPRNQKCSGPKRQQPRCRKQCSQPANPVVSGEEEDTGQSRTTGARIAGPNTCSIPFLLCGHAFRNRMFDGSETAPSPLGFPVCVDGGGGVVHPWLHGLYADMNTVSVSMRTGVHYKRIYILRNLKK